MRAVLLFAGLLTASGGAAAATRNHVYIAPAEYVGRTVLVCGYRDGPNLFESSIRDEWPRTGGLSIRDPGLLPVRAVGNVCIEGEVSYLGCETSGECIDAAFDYAISISRVVSVDPRLRRAR